MATPAISPWVTPQDGLGCVAPQPHPCIPAALLVPGDILKPSFGFSLEEPSPLRPNPYSRRTRGASTCRSLLPPLQAHRHIFFFPRAQFHAGTVLPTPHPPCTPSAGANTHSHATPDALPHRSSPRKASPFPLLKLLSASRPSPLLGWPGRRGSGRHGAGVPMLLRHGISSSRPAPRKRRLF